MRLLLLCAAITLVVSPRMGAQSKPKDDVIVLDMQVQKNGTVISRPTVSMKVGGDATLPIGDVGSMTVTPTCTNATTIELTWKYTDRDVSPTLQMRLSGHEKASATLHLGAHTLVFDAAVRDVPAN